MEDSVDLQQEPTFRDLVALLRRGLLLAAIVAVAAAAVTYVLTKQMHTAYQAAATSDPVVADAMKHLGTANPSETQIQNLLKNVSVRVDSSNRSSLLHIDVKNGNPHTAANTANALAGALLAWDKQRATQNLQKIVQALKGQIASLNAQISQVQAAPTPDQAELSGLQNLQAQQQLQLSSAQALENSAVGNVEILEPAPVPIEPSSPRPVLDSTLAFILGVFFVYGLLLLRDALDTRFRGTEDLARAAATPVIAEFPSMSGGTRHLPREAATYLRTNLLFATNQDHPKVILVTSAGSNEGKTSVAMSLAESFAYNDYRTVLVDADLRNPCIGREYRLSPQDQPPLRSLLEEPSMSYRPAAVALEGAELHVVPSYVAAPSPSELLARSFARVIGRLAEDYDVIVVDSPPVLPVADALTMAPHTTGVLFPVSLPTADRGRVGASLALLKRIGVRVLGVVATNLDASRSGRAELGYGYGNGYGNGYGTDMYPAPTVARDAPVARDPGFTRDEAHQARQDG